MGGRPLDDMEAELVERARGGDPSAFGELVRRYQDLAFRVAYVIVGSAEEAEDATQEAFIRAYNALGTFRTGSPLRPWLLTIVANAARSRRSAAFRHPTLALSAVEDRPSDNPAQLPEVEALAAERRHELLDAVHILRDEDRQVIACRYFLDLTEAETAEVLRCPRGTVKSRLSRALRRLRQQLTSSASLEGSHDG